MAMAAIPRGLPYPGGPEQAVIPARAGMTDKGLIRALSLYR